MAVAVGVAGCGPGDGASNPAARAPEAPGAANPVTPAVGAVLASIPWPARAESIDARRGQLGEPRRGSFTAGDAETRWTAYSIAGRPVKIEARLDAGEYGASDLDYYLDPLEDALILLRERGVRRRAGAGGTAERDSVRVEVSYDTGGRVLTSWRTIDGVDTPLQSVELDGLRAHFDTIRRAHP
jgi:hypothetical protein